MKRWVVAAALGVALAVCIALPLLARDSVPRSRYPSTVVHDAADLTVSAAGDLSVRESLDVDFPGRREYLFYRAIDRNDPADPRVRRDVTDLHVTLDGHAVDYVATPASYGRFLVVRIGGGAHFLTRGRHTYVISYRMAHVLESGGSDPTRFDWDLVSGTFAEPIESADLDVHLPAPTGAVRCAVAPADAGTRCTVSGGGTPDIRVTTGALPRSASVRLDAGLPTPPPPGPSELPWSTRMLPVLGPDRAGILAVLVLALLAGVGGRVLARGAFERPLPEPPTDEPPDGIGPAAAAYVVHERIDHRAFVASLFWAAQQRIVRIRQDGNRWGITPEPLADGRAPGPDDVTTGLMAFLGGPGGSFVARKGDASAYDELHLRLAEFEDAVRDWCVREGYLRRTGPGRRASLVLVGLAIFAAFFAALDTVAGRSISGLVPAAFAVGARPLVHEGAATRRTAHGRELAARLIGLRRRFSSPLAAGVGARSPEDLYVAFLPWAVMLGCLDPWTRRYRESTGIEPPLPPFLEDAVVPAGDGGGRDDVEAVILDFSQAWEARERRRHGEES